MADDTQKFAGLVWTAVIVSLIWIVILTIASALH